MLASAGRAFWPLGTYRITPKPQQCSDQPHSRLPATFIAKPEATRWLNCYVARMSGMPAATLPDWLKEWIIGVLCLCGLGVFAGLFAYGVYQEVGATRPPTNQEVTIYLATALTALVGGVVSISLATNSGGRNTNIGGWHVSTIVSVAYVVVYLLVGIAAIATWWVCSNADTSTLIKGVATAFAGLVLPTIVAFLYT
jgi:hypothetical protein